MKILFSSIRLPTLLGSILSAFFISAIVGFAFASKDDLSVKSVNLLDLVGKKAWEEYKSHLITCEVCSNLSDDSKYKMCPYSFILADAARPMITNDQLRLMAQGKLKITMD